MPRPYCYSAFGLGLTCNRPIPGLRTTDPQGSDIRIWMGEVPAHVSRHEGAEPWYPRNGDAHTDGLKAWRLADGQCFRLLYADGTEFFVNHAGTEIYAAWADSSTIEDTSIYLLGPVLGFALRLRGTACLHASAVEVGGRAIALLGPGQAGKSTTAAAFASRGHSVLTDDVAPILERHGVPHLQPTYGQVRLWPDSVALLYGSEEALPLLTPNWTKRALDLGGHRGGFQDRPLQLAAIYVLGERTEGSEHRIEPLSGRDALRTLLANSYVGYLLDRAAREEEFACLSRLVQRVALRRVISRHDPSQLPALCSRILDDVEEIGCTASPTTAR